MDTSPTRLKGTHRSPTLSPLRRENTKTIPKFSGEQNPFKQKYDPQKCSPLLNTTTASVSSATIVTSTDACISEPKTVGVAPKSPTAQTKIPTSLKRPPTSTYSPKPVGTPRGPPVLKPQMKSPSKISLTIKEIGGKKLEPNSSKLSFKAATSTNLRPPMSLAKAMGGRGPLGVGGISRRSGSTVSCKSIRSQRNDSTEGPNNLSPPILVKCTPGVGDHDTLHGLSARERVAENNKVKVFENMYKKLVDLQSEFMLKFEALKVQSPEKLKGDFKFITMIKNDECKLVVSDDDQLKVPKKLPATSVSDLKEKIKIGFDNSLMVMLDNLEHAGDNIDETKKQLEMEQVKQLNEINNYIHEVCLTKELEADIQIVKMQKEIQEGRKALKAAEKRQSELKSSQQEEIHALEKGLRDKMDGEIAKRDTQIAELQKRNKVVEKQNEKLKSNVQHTSEETLNEQAEKSRLQDELRAAKESIQSLTKKLTHAEQQLTHEKKEKHEKAENLHKLEGELEVARKRIEDLQNKGKTEQQHQIKDQQKEIHMLKEQVQDLDQTKQELENQIEELRCDSEALQDLQKEYARSQERIRDLQKIVQEHSNKLLHDPSDLPKEVQNELAKLRQSESEKRREIEKLKMELSKAYFSMCQLEEQIQRDQQLLEVRSELINSLQTNDNSQRIHLDEMFAQAGEKNNTINEVGLNNELRTKSEEFRNLFTTLSTKQLELSRQEHMIKLLEESNERSQMLRVKQEEKIGRMEEEIAHLKQTLRKCHYQSQTALAIQY